ncbi:carbohydrate ABC transporter permease [Curtobacterium sp. Leaf261]|uniref:carbohydrate ABC transporter permease n=1 Tax=Curtobacterium sp. Leaf261 TaxID=1736311 RepID=UPI000AB37683|nr:carbohydrate ABC transporter permease [Curtobacterium sp. Leaf261]
MTATTDVTAARGAGASRASSPDDAVADPTAGTRVRARRKRPRRTVATVLAIVFCAIWVFPIYWMVVTAFKPKDEVTTLTPIWFPLHPTVQNFVRAVTQEHFLLYLRNSAIVVVAAVLLSIVVGFLASAALSRFRFRGRRAILVAILFVQMIPSGALLIPLFLSFQSLNLLNSYVGLILAYVASVLPFSIWVMRGFFVAVPVEIEEAAKTDGAGTFRILWSVLFPLVMPGVIATSVFAFIAAWNDYLTAYVMLKDQSMYTLPVWLATFSTNKGTDYGALMAASVLFSLPVVVFFLIVQRRLVAGMTAGAVKG